jgi:hypothetical protein
MRKKNNNNKNAVNFTNSKKNLICKYNLNVYLYISTSDIITFLDKREGERNKNITVSFNFYNKKQIFALLS